MVWKFRTGIKQINERKRRPPLLPGDSVRILGRKYRLSVRKKENCRVELGEDTLTVYSPSGKRSGEYLKILEIWKGRMLRSYCSDTLHRFSKILPGVSVPSSVRVRKKVLSLAGYGKSSRTIFVSPALYEFSPMGIDYVLAWQTACLLFGEDSAEKNLHLLLGDFVPYWVAYEYDMADTLLDSIPDLPELSRF